VETAEAEIVLSRARIQLAERGAASAGLEAMVARSVGTGYLAAQKAAARELRAIGRRLRPATGTGWDGLSPRERDVALLLAEGFGNQQIAAELHLSEHTVQAHVSRVLAAFGAASRLVVAAQLSMLVVRDIPADAAPALTPRQTAVAARIANGLSNEAIAGELGVSTKTVEKHVSEILRRWDVSSRIGIARIVITQRDAPITRDPGSTASSPPLNA
jgi:DNA-binding NarL/FixJ family response regulator